MTDPKPSVEPTDSDFVDRVFDYLQAEFPGLSARRLAKARDALRAEFAGGRAYVASRTPTERQALVQEVLSKFNGRNATEVARRLAKARDALRAEFAGGRAYVASRTPTERQALVQEVLSKFNGRNASEVARRLGIGRATVYRHLKQARFPDSVNRRPDRLKFGGSDTANPLGSAPATALAPPPDPAETQEPTAWPSPPPTSPPSTPPSPAASSPSATTAAPSPTAAWPT